VFVVGVFAHEAGHALAALALGARITSFNVLGIQWFPALAWRPQLGFLGWVAWFGSLSPAENRLVLVAGSLTTLLLAVAAAYSLHRFRPQGLARWTAIMFSLYWLDGVVHLLPIFGVRAPLTTPRTMRSFAEAYFAVTELGLPGPLYIAFVALMAGLCCTLLVRSLRLSSLGQTHDRPPFPHSTHR
jgi:hypothetical protein